MRTRHAGIVNPSKWVWDFKIDSTLENDRTPPTPISGLTHHSHRETNASIYPWSLLLFPPQWWAAFSYCGSMVDFASQLQSGI